MRFLALVLALMAARIDRDTRQAIAGPADARAARAGCRYRPRRAEHAVEFFRRFLVHTKGQHAGRPFELLPWQRERLVGPLFGWEWPDGTRRFQKVYCEIPKKNGKSTLAAGIGLYMLLGDGEAGAHVFSAATDKAQARIVHDEAIAMVEASPLRNLVRVNRTTGAIWDPRRGGRYLALSNVPEGKEGLDASCVIIDELHVWPADAALWNALRYAFAARRQPLRFVITTAGESPEGVCWTEHEYAAGVTTGTIAADRYLGLIYAAGPGDDWTRPATWRKANPSLAGPKNPAGWLREEDFRAEVDEAKAKPREIPPFRRYRLNEWIAAVGGWLPPAKWQACRRPPAELSGRDCWAGLDLARTRDTTALVLLFPREGGRYRLLPHFWLPEETALEQRELIPWFEWRKAGLVTLTGGEVTDYAFVERAIGELAGRYRILGLGFDPYRAEELTQRVSEATGVERIAFAQTVQNFAAPTEEFERLTLAELLEHDGHAVLAWQAANARVRCDANGNLRPVKPPAAELKKIDGIVAAIMALGLAMRGGATSLYETQGIAVSEGRGT